MMINNSLYLLLSIACDEFLSPGYAHKELSPLSDKTVSSVDMSIF
jgi:hypothetical protein